MKKLEYVTLADVIERLGEINQKMEVEYAVIELPDVGRGFVGIGYRLKDKIPVPPFVG